jgi:hypothetical protein
MSTTYCIDSDVNIKLSNIKVASGIVTETFRVGAFNRINAKLRKLYIVPVVSTDDTDIGLLKGIESNIAAGRLLLSVSTINELENAHAYALELIKQGEGELKELVSEDLVLSAEAERDTDDSDEAVNPPFILGHAPDANSTFNRPMSGIENDAIDGIVDSGVYNSLYDNKTV